MGYVLVLLLGAGYGHFHKPVNHAVKVAAVDTAHATKKAAVKTARGFLWVVWDRPMAGKL